LTPPTSPGGAWTETVLYNFTGGNDGSDPRASLIADKNGVLYGTTSLGGTGGGTAFSLTPPKVSGGIWTETVIASFGAYSGYDPFSPLLMDANGVRYGTTYSGGNSAQGDGVAFSLTPPSGGGPWTETILHAFSEFVRDGDGQGPYAGLLAGPKEHSAEQPLAADTRREVTVPFSC
jgi:hypothetical protein